MIFNDIYMTQLAKLLSLHTKLITICKSLNVICIFIEKGSGNDRNIYSKLIPSDALSNLQFVNKYKIVTYFNKDYCNVRSLMQQNYYSEIYISIIS